jgi:hypothetical protein
MQPALIRTHTHARLGRGLAAAGGQIGPVVSVLGANLANGLFNAELDFGATAFDGDARWIESAIRSPAGSGVYTTLTPRQPLSAAPYARHAVHAENGGVLTIDNGQPGVMWTRSPNGTDVFLAGGVNAGFGFSSPTARLHVRAPAGRSSRATCSPRPTARATR